MSEHLGDPDLDYAILGGGNTSAQIDSSTFWVKASSAELRTIEASGFVLVRFALVLDLLEPEGVDDQAIKTALEAAKVDPTARARPSVETVLHAIALQLEGVSLWDTPIPRTARVILGVYALGEPWFMTQQAADRIHTRPDEQYAAKSGVPSVSRRPKHRFGSSPRAHQLPPVAAMGMVDESR